MVLDKERLFVEPAEDGAPANKIATQPHIQPPTGGR